MRKKSSGKDLILGTHTLFIFEWRTRSNFDKVMGPKTDMWGLEIDNEMLGIEATCTWEQCKHPLLYHAMSWEKILPMSGDIGNDFKNEKTIVFILFCERTLKVLILKEKNSNWSSVK